MRRELLVLTQETFCAANVKYTNRLRHLSNVLQMVLAYVERVFLWITLRPLARKYFSTQIDLVTGVVTRFINAIISSPTGATQHYTAVQEQPASKKEM